MFFPNGLQSFGCNEPWEATLLKSQMKNKHLKACETFDLKNDKTEEKKTLTYCS